MVATQAAIVALAMPAAPVDVAAREAMFVSERVHVTKAEWAERWPFSIDEGELVCVEFGGSRSVFFSEILSDEEAGTFGNMKLPRDVAVTTNPLALFATVENRDLYLPFDSLETLITRLAPMEAFGTALCVPQDKREL